MKESSGKPKPVWVLFRQAEAAVRSRFNLRDDQADHAAMDEALRAGVVMRGSQLWVLMFAIVIASVGLNVNSAAVVIGAMLISPLMGPIIGVGYGLGIYDFELIAKSLRNLSIASLIGLLASAAYFLVSPLTTPGSELLARTTPTIWDVLIALFGGFAGIIGTTRREKSNVIPGVAIATALMPPLCTAGFGLATANWHFFLGASYLFVINCVFIAFSAVVVISFFNLPHKQFVDDQTSRRVHRYLGIVIVFTVAPSLYLAYKLVQEEVFKARASQFVHQELALKQTHVAELSIDPQSKQIEVTLIGEKVSQDKLADITSRLPLDGLPNATLVFHQTDDPHLDMTSLKVSLLNDLYKDTQVALKEKDDTIKKLEGQVAAFTSSRDRFKELPRELHAFYPQIDNILVADANDWSTATDAKDQNVVILSARSTTPLSNTDQSKIEEWLRQRTQSKRVRVVMESGEPNPSKTASAPR